MIKSDADINAGHNSIFPELQLFESLLLIRYTEEMIAANYKDQQMRTAVHLGTGQEAVAVGVCSNLRPGDAVYSHHRSHNHFLASGGTVFSLVAELYGSVMGCSKGRGGSVHLTHDNSVFFASTAILGEGVALAVGSALNFAMKGEPNLAVTFFGDAVWEEGVIYESLNFAAIHSLPVLFVCENNSYSTESPASTRKAMNSEFTARAESFGITSLKVDGNNLPQVHRTVLELTESVRREPKPYLIECETYRWREHVGPNFDHDMGRTYRSKEELLEWQKRDPVVFMREHLLSQPQFSVADLDEIDRKVNEKVRTEFEKAKNSPAPESESLMENSGEL